MFSPAARSKITLCRSVIVYGQCIFFVGRFFFACAVYTNVLRTGLSVSFLSILWLQAVFLWSSWLQHPACPWTQEPRKTTSSGATSRPFPKEQFHQVKQIPPSQANSIKASRGFFATNNVPSEFQIGWKKKISIVRVCGSEQHVGQSRRIHRSRMCVKKTVDSSWLTAQIFRSWKFYECFSKCKIETRSALWVLNKFSRQKQDMPFIIPFEKCFLVFFACGEQRTCDAFVVSLEQWLVGMS